MWSFVGCVVEAMDSPISQHERIAAIGDFRCLGGCQLTAGTSASETGGG